jgi:hypothetical protein
MLSLGMDTSDFFVCRPIQIKTRVYIKLNTTVGAGLLNILLFLGKAAEMEGNYTGK